MKILIAADMEGITGVVHVDQTNPSHAEYDRFRRLMTGDVNAAIRGAFDAGADEVVVSDGHWSNLNILIEELDPAPGSTPAPRGRSRWWKAFSTASTACSSSAITPVSAPRTRSSITPGRAAAWTGSGSTARSWARSG